MNQEPMKFTTYLEHRKFLNSIEERLLETCRKEPRLSHIVHIFDSCENSDPKLNQLISEHLNDRTQRHFGRAFKIAFCFNENHTDFIFVKQNANIHDLRKAIERDIALFLQIKNKKGNNNFKIRKIFKKICWKTFWKKYDILLDGSRISFSSSTIPEPENFKLSNDCLIKLVPKRL